MDDNLKILYEEVEWLEKVIHQVITSYLKQDGHENVWTEIEIPNVENARDTWYGSFLQSWQLNKFERLALALTMSVHLRPNILDVFYGKNKIYDRPFTEFGGSMDHKHNGFIPTGQTFLFITT